jgi:hypothetical protein
MLWYKAITSIGIAWPFSEALLPIIAFCSGVYFPYGALFRLFVVAVITERTSTLAAAMDEDGITFFATDP